jgi:hypothetical protein
MKAQEFRTELMNRTNTHEADVFNPSATSFTLYYKGNRYDLPSITTSLYSKAHLDYCIAVANELEATLQELFLRMRIEYTPESLCK